MAAPKPTPHQVQLWCEEIVQLEASIEQLRQKMPKPTTVTTSYCHTNKLGKKRIGPRLKRKHFNKKDKAAAKRVKASIDAARRTIRCLRRKIAKAYPTAPKGHKKKDHPTET